MRVLRVFLRAFELHGFFGVWRLFGWSSQGLYVSWQWKLRIWYELRWEATR